MRHFTLKYIKISAACFMLLFAFNTTAQTDTVNIVKGQVKPVEKTSNHSPRTATLLAFIPGGGQIYNRKYWKLPILYGGIGACAYFAVWNQNKYNIYSSAFDMRLNGETDPFAGIYTDEQLIATQNYYSRNREVSIVIGIGIYAISFLDANVDAHLYNFDVSDDISMKIEPATFTIENSPLFYNGIRLAFNF